MADNEKKQTVTTVWRADVAQFKKSIAEATAEMKLANAGFEAATAGMDDWSKSTEGLEAKIKQLAAVTEANNKMLEAYKGQLAATRKAKESLTKEAEDLAKAMADMKAAGKESSEEYKELSKQFASCEKDIAKITKAETDLATKMLKAEAAAKKSAKEMDKYGDQLKEVENAAGGVENVMDDITDAVEDAADAAEDAGDGFTIFKGILSNLASSAVLKGLDLIADGVQSITEGLLDACSAADQLKSATNDFSTQTGIDTDENPQYKKAIQNIYTDNYGDSYSDIANSMATVKQTTGITDADSLERMTRDALLLRDVFGFDIQEQMRTVDMLMTQFGVSAETAFNLVAQGAQSGLNKNGDLLDTINEYSVHYKQLGYDAEQMFNSLANGADAGTFSVDKLGDAVKEFGIRSKDGSASSIEAFEMLGLNGDVMTDHFAAGGEKAEAAMEIVIQRLLSMDDAVAQNAVGVALFGSAWEDLGVEGIAALSDMEGSISSTTDAMQEINNVKFDSVGAAIEGIKRKLETYIFIPIGEKILPKVSEVAGKFEEWLEDPATQQAIEELTTALANFVTNGLEMILDGAMWFIENKDIIIAGLVGITTAFGAFKVASLITTVVTALQGMGTAAALAAAKQWLLNTALLANPIGLIIALVAGLVAAFVTLWNNSEEFRNFWIKLWEGLKDAVGDAVEWLRKKLDALGQFFKDMWEGIKQGFKGAVKWIGEKISEIGRFFTETLPETLLSAVDALFQVGYNLIAGLIEGILSAVGWLWDTITEIGNGIVDWFCDVLDINSPSRRIRDVVGKMIPPAIGIGVEANADTALKSIRKFGNDIVKNLDVSGVSDKLSVIREGFTGGTVKVAAEAIPAGVGGGNTTRTTNHKSVTYAPTFKYNKPLNSKEIYRQNKNMLGKIVGVDND